MNQIEMEKIANAFDQDKDGLIDLNEIMAVLKGSRRAQPVSQAAASDSDKIDSEVRNKKATIRHSKCLTLCYAIHTDPAAGIKVYMCQ